MLIPQVGTGDWYKNDKVLLYEIVIYDSADLKLMIGLPSKEEHAEIREKIDSLAENLDMFKITRKGLTKSWK